MNKMRPLNLTTPSDREIRVERTFEAPREIVFEAHTRPELLKRWMYGPEELALAECKIDLKVGGELRYVWRNSEGKGMGLSGVFREIVVPEKTVHTELFDEDWTGGEAIVTTLFEEREGRTTVTTTVLYSSKEARDGALKTEMLEGWGQAYDRLADLLSSAPLN